MVSDDDTAYPGAIIPLHYHFNMLNDQIRTGRFRQAIQAVVAPGSKVLELGGGTGVLSFFAAQLASKVWCVEKNPELAREARRFLDMNTHGDRVQVVNADAFEYLPPEPVDVVVCEMLHVAMLRENQITVIERFKQRYLAHFGLPLPIFVPEASIQTVQPVQQNFEFSGYYAPVPIFRDPYASQAMTLGMGAPVVYSTLRYEASLPMRFQWEGEISIATSGTLNALRFVTKNILATLPVLAPSPVKNILAVPAVHQSTAIEWHNQHLVMPLASPLEVHAGDMLRLAFSYPAGGALNDLASSLTVAMK
jgi:protein arginine N-methyltransferase 1